VVATFAIVSITMPILGVAVGSAIVDKLGGYSGKEGVARTLKICAIFAVIAASAALATCFVPPGGSAFAIVVSLICVTLFFGGCIIPSATGVLMEVAVPEARAVASAGSMFAFQLFGYALSPLVSAIVMQIAGDNASGAALDAAGTAGTAADGGAVEITPAQLELGFRTVMAWGLFGALFFCIAWRAAERERRLAAGETRDVTMAVAFGFWGGSM
jgi:MFS family permease